MSDLYDMRRRIRDFDPTLDVLKMQDGYWHVVREEAELQCLGHFDGSLLYAPVLRQPTIFRCRDRNGLPRPPDARDLRRLREIDTWNRPGTLERIDRHNAAITRSAERSVSDAAYEMGKDMHRLLQRSGSL